MRNRLARTILLTSMLTTCVSAFAADAVTPGKLTVDPPTLICLGVCWKIDGDDNRNASVKLSYRAEGDATWKEGLPLVYVDPEGLTFVRRKTDKGLRDSWEANPEGAAFSRKIPRMFAGSIFDLKPDTTYEIRLQMTDRDGGGAERRLKSRTRPVPRAAPNAKVVRVKPQDLQAAVDAAKPGTVIEVAPGIFKGVLNLKGKIGTPEKPIVIRGSAGNSTILEGDNKRFVVNANDTQYVFLENLLIRGPVKTCAIECNGAKGLVVRRCRFENLGEIAHGVLNGNWSRPASDLYIADNVFIGDRTWPKTFRDFKGDTVTVKICGRGNVVCYNLIRGWNTAVQGNENTRRVYALDSFDIYGNDCRVCLASTIEVDGGTHNIRVFRNRLTNCYFGVSTQPIYGGPCYIFRNVMYDTYNTPYKMHNSPSGCIYFHNTSVRAGPAFYCQAGDAVHNCVWRNNLHLGSSGKDRNGQAGPRAWGNWNRFISPDLDYDGFTEGRVSFNNKGRYGSFREFMRKNTLGIEKHGVVVDLAIFAKQVKFPQLTEEESEPPDLRLKANSAAVDKGIPLPNINDGYRGRAPDLGAYELGEPEPHYGPRPQ